jgi:energy-coupling factor transport system ATP-binding protein
VAILGPNGSGKSTLLKLALALVRPQQGTVRVGGRDAREQTVAQLARQVAYVFQSPRQMLFGNSVREELAFAPKNLGMSRDETERVTASALDLVGLDTVEGIWERSPYSLSFGQQKRLAIAAALSMQPQAIVVDEPSAGQDYGQAVAFLSEIDRIPGLQSVYFITHDIDLALLFADRCLLFKDGQLQGAGPPLEVLANPQELERLRLRPSSLLRANLAMRAPGEPALNAEQLAKLIIDGPRSKPN